MAEAKVSRGKVVSVTYTIRDQADDNLLEAVEIPVDYLHGGRTGLYEKIEAALEGKAVGEGVEVLLTPEDAFGPSDPDLTFTDVIENVPPDFRRLGAQAEFTNEAGEVVTMTVTHLDAGTITLDGNHPLAGKNLIFSVRVAAVRDATAQELMTGEVAQAQGLH
jgi:FKBP-type peptidyl-prolyl cis-trans isomerases 2